MAAQWQQLLAESSDNTARYFETIARNSAAAFQSTLQSTNQAWGMASDAARINQQKLQQDRAYQLDLQQNARSWNADARADYTMRVGYAEEKAERERRYAIEDQKLKLEAGSKLVAGYTQAADSYESRYFSSGDPKDLEEAKKLREKSLSTQTKIISDFERFETTGSFAEKPLPPTPGRFTPDNVPGMDMNDGMVLPPRGALEPDDTMEGIGPPPSEEESEMEREILNRRDPNRLQNGGIGTTLIDDMTQARIKTVAAPSIGNTIGAYINDESKRIESELGPVRNQALAPVSRIIDDAFAKSFPKVSVNVSPTAATPISINPAPRDRTQVPDAAIQQAEQYLSNIDRAGAWVAGGRNDQERALRARTVEARTIQSRQLLLQDEHPETVAELNRRTRLYLNLADDTKADKTLSDSVTQGYLTRKQADELTLAREGRRASANSPARDVTTKSEKVVDSLTKSLSLAKSMTEAYKAAEELTTSQPDSVMDPNITAQVRSEMNEAYKRVAKAAGDLPMLTAKREIEALRDEINTASGLGMDPTVRDNKVKALSELEQNFENVHGPKVRQANGESAQRIASAAIKEGKLPANFNYRQLAQESGATKEGERMFMEEIVPQIIRATGLQKPNAENIAARLFRAEIQALENIGMQDAFSGEVFGENEQPVAAAVEATAQESPEQRQNFVPADVRERIGAFASQYQQASDAVRASGMAGPGAQPSPAETGAMEEAVNQAAEALLPDIRRRYVTSNGKLTDAAMSALKETGQEREGMEGEEILELLARTSAMRYFSLIGQSGAAIENRRTARSERLGNL
jgi:hypothetical protein